MKKLRAKFALVASLLLLIVPGTASADVNDFVITDFSADYYLSRSDPQGALTIHERLTVDFADQNHGILRALPMKYNGMSQHIHIDSVERDGVAEPYTTYHSNGNEVLKIGNAGRTITGSHVYNIDYNMQNVIRFTTAGDELDWNTNGTEWQQSFQHVTARLRIPAGMNPLVGAEQCFTGSQGSTAHDCAVTTAGRVAVFATTRAMGPGETMTFAARFPVGTFQKPTTLDWWKDHALPVVLFTAPTVLAFGIAFRRWWRYGKDLKGHGTIIPEYGPPDDMSAVEADGLLHYRVTNRGLSATIIDLAIRKYLRITESESDGVLGIGRHKQYSFILLSGNSSSLKLHEAKVLAGLFQDSNTVTTQDLKNKFYMPAGVAKQQVMQALISSGYLATDPRSAQAINILLAIPFFLLGVITWRAGSLALSLGGFAGAVIMGLFAAIMPRRPQKGVDACDTLMGLKLYMNVAEKDRIAMLQSPGAPYAAGAGGPERTVELFEKLLPYAIALGVEQGWAEQFADIYKTPPDWFQGNWTAFNTGYLVGSLASSMDAMNASFAAPSSSNSGGGFAGGGGGGGGGGGW